MEPSIERQAGQDSSPPECPVSVSVSSCQELLAAVNLSSAVGRLRRESRHSQTEPNEGSSFVSVLRNYQAEVLERIILVEETGRIEEVSNKTRNVSVIRHPLVDDQCLSSIRTSTPNDTFIEGNGYVSEEPEVSLIPTVKSLSSDLDEVFDNTVDRDILCHCESNISEKDLRRRCPVTSLNSPEISLHSKVVEYQLKMENLQLKIKSDVKKVRIKMRGYTADDIQDKEDCQECLSFIEKFDLLFEDTIVQMENLVEDYANALPEDEKESAKTLAREFEAEVKTYKASLRTKIRQLRSGVVNTASAVPEGENLQAQHVQLLREQVEQTKEANKDAREESERQKDAAKSQAIGRIITKSKAISEDAHLLSETLLETAPEDWESEDDLKVEQGMKHLDKWKEDLDKIVKNLREVKEIKASNNIESVITELISAEVETNNVKQNFSLTKESIEGENVTRELYTLDVSSNEKLKYPIFEGKDEECFADFRKKMDEALVHNRVKRSAKVGKLRESLRGHPKNLVPDSAVDVDAAWAALEKAFGDPTKLLNHKLQSLIKLGQLPRQNGKDGMKAVVEWYLKLETTVTSLLELGKATSNEDVKYAVYNVEIVRTIAKLFPQNVGILFVEYSDTGEKRLKLVLEKIAELRQKSQSWLLVQDLAPSIPGTSNSGAPGGSHDGGSHGRDYGGGRGGVSRGRGRGANYQYGQRGRAKGTYQSTGTTNSPVLVFHNPPINDPNCRVCQFLEKSGDTTQLYDNHVSNYPTGCPRFIMMCIDERLALCKKIRYCWSCLNPAYTHSIASIKDHKCIANNGYRKKSIYTCPENTCRTHLWVCAPHKNNPANKEALERFRKEIRDKYNLQFAFIVNIPITAYNPSNQRVGVDPYLTVESTSSSIAPIAETALECCPNGMTEEDALAQLQRKLHSKGMKEKLRPVDHGSPVFILGYTKGKTRPLLTLYDTGCGSGLFKEGVPNNELSPAIKTNPGPIYVNGVGDTTVKVNGEWMMSVKLRDGTRAVLEGCSVDKITAALPLTNLTEAEKEIKSDAAGNNTLQSLKCYPKVGGQDLDILLGIMYQAFMPVLVHQMPNGLSIFELVIESHDSLYTAVIGGPHETFNQMASYCGGFGLLCSNLTSQLESFRNYGPPSISRCLMTEEDLAFALEFQEDLCEGYNKHYLDHILKDDEEEDASNRDEIIKKEVQSRTFVNDERDLVSTPGPSLRPPLPLSPCERIPNGNEDVEISDNGEILKIPDNEHAKIVDGVELGDGAFLVDCHNCGNKLDLSCLPTHRSDGEEDWHLKLLHKATEEGLRIEYRCPKCRNCTDCRNSHETERVSLREEAEDLMIRDSINIDWEEKKIICYLPTRGNEEEFLSNNRDIASKILQQQCLKYSKDHETKEMIIKAFNKLLENKQLILWDDLSEDDKQIIENKPVSHYIVWRVVFKNN